jgi:hypothetical protein
LLTCTSGHPIGPCHTTFDDIIGSIDANPKSVITKRYSTVGCITRPVNLIIPVIPPLNIGDQFRDFWVVYGSFIGISAGAFVISVCYLSG